LLARTGSLACDPIAPDPAQESLPEYALAGVRCSAPIDGVAELELFTFPGTWRLRLHHIDQVENSKASVRPAPDACRQGRTGVRKWEHGRVACWRLDSGSQGVLHWIDERADLYGIIRADAGANRRLDDAWRALTDQLEPN
jgi:hypothetical protein